MTLSTVPLNTQRHISGIYVAVAVRSQGAAILLLLGPVLEVMAEASLFFVLGFYVATALFEIPKLLRRHRRRMPQEKYRDGPTFTLDLNLPKLAGNRKNMFRRIFCYDGSAKT